MLSQAAEVAFSPELCHKLFSAGNCRLPVTADGTTGSRDLHLWKQQSSLESLCFYIKVQKEVKSCRY